MIPTSRSEARSPAAVFLLIGLVLLSTGRSLGNGFAFDDVPIIVENAQVHAVSPPWVYARQSYWPPQNLGDAYRPWTIWLFAIQWAIGGGSPMAFHVVNLALTVAITLLVCLIARRLLPPIGAIAAAALFAVHPVHVEATGNAVGQAELWMATFVLVGVLLYLRSRDGSGSEPGIPGTGTRLALAGLLILAAASKEQGIVLPVLLVALELVILRHRSPVVPARALMPTWLLLGVTAVAFLVARFLVLGDLGGGPPAEGLEGLGIAQRSLVMLPVALDWLRLLVWPRDLLAQYSPPAYGAPPAWSVAAVAGLLLVTGVAIVAIGAARKAPVVTFAIAWIAITGALVSNIPVPTGIIIAERTLFLPSVGVVLLAGAGIAWATGRGGAARWAALGATAVLLALGSARSFSRQAVWRDSVTLMRQTIVDEPRSYRAWRMLGAELTRHRRIEEAVDAYRRAAELYTGDHRVYEELGQNLRQLERYDEAAAELSRGLAIHPDATLMRSRLFESLLAAGRWDEAEAVAREGFRRGASEFEASLERLARRRAGT